MFDTHNSIAVRNAGELIKNEMGNFNMALSEAMNEIDHVNFETPWYKLLSKDASFWDDAERQECYRYIRDNFWKEKNIKPPIKLVYEITHGEEDIEPILKKWCEADDRHISLEDAKYWIQTNECGELMDQYIKSSGGYVPVDDDDPFNPEKEHSQHAYEYVYFDDSEENYDFDKSWGFIINQIQYVDNIAPEITNQAKLEILRTVLASQPITAIFKNKKQYIAMVQREKELSDAIKE